MNAPDAATRLLDPLALPPFAAITPDAILPALDRTIAEHEAVVATLTAIRPTVFAEAWLPYERANAALTALWSAVSHLHAVADTPELRAAYAQGQVRLVENEMKVGQNRDLYEVFVALSASPAFAALPDADRVAVEHEIHDFTLSGVALDTEQRDHFKAVSIELSDLSTQFGSAVLDRPTRGARPSPTKACSPACPTPTRRCSAMPRSRRTRRAGASRCNSRASRRS